MNEVVKKELSAPALLAQQIEDRTDSFALSLPKHIPLERFKRVIVNAAMKNPKLLSADRPTLIQSAMMAAQDGLLPDGREAAFVIFNTKMKIVVNGKEVEKWVDAVQYMPMVAGILKKIRNSGQVATIVARVVYEGDQYRYWIDSDGEHLEYQPCDAPGKPLRVFAMAKTNDGDFLFEPMTMAEVQKVRNVSRAKDNGPWKEWFEEMAKKTAIRRLSKRLPMSTDLDDLIRRDDALYDLEGASDKAASSRPQLSDFKERVGSDEPTGSVSAKKEDERKSISTTKDAPSGEQAANDGQPSASDGAAAAEEPGSTAESSAAAQRSTAQLAGDVGYQHAKEGRALRAMPAEYRGDEAMSEAYTEGYKRFQDEQLA
jgi:recombination protein RecT